MPFQGQICTYLGFLCTKPKQASQRCLRSAGLLFLFLGLLLLAATNLPKASSLQQSNRAFRQQSQTAPSITNSQAGCAAWTRLSSQTCAVSASVERLLLLLLQNLWNATCACWLMRTAYFSRGRSKLRMSDRLNCTWHC